MRAALRLARAYRNNLPHALREAALLAAIRGRPERARALLNQSMELAGRQKAPHELAQSLLARGAAGRAARLVGSGRGPAPGRASCCRPWSCAGAIRGGRSTPGPVTLSLADRFDQIMDRGRQLASALTREAVQEAVRTAALALLRGERAFIVDVAAHRGRSCGWASGRRARRRCRPGCWNGR